MAASPTDGDAEKRHKELKRVLDELNDGLRAAGLPVPLQATSGNGTTNGNAGPAEPMNTNALLESTITYVRRGWRVVPIPHGNGKAPKILDWPKLRIEEDDLPHYFSDGENIGIILGEPSAGLVDIDLDAPEAIAAAEKILPPTGMIHGRTCKPRSHRWYIANPLTATAKYQAPDGTMLVELRSTGCQTLAPPSIHPSGEPYSWHANGDPAVVNGKDLSARVGLVASVAMLARLWPKEPGQRHDIAMALAGFLLQCRNNDSGTRVSATDAFKIMEQIASIAGDDEIRDRLRAVASTADKIAHSKPVVGVRSLEQLLGAGVIPRLLDWLKLQRANEASGASVAYVAASGTPSEAPAWPSPIAEDAFHGLVGDVLRTIEPHTESDSAAILVQFLVAFGNAAGRSAFYQVEGDAHHTNLFAVQVGVSSKSRKGTSWGQVRRLMRAAAESGDRWHLDRIQSGLSSGEGLIWAVRDPGAAGDEDLGVEDKRLLAVETEFARPLVAMAREGNVLSELLRVDTGDLQILTKNNPATAKGAHISIIGHITRDDLRRHLSSTEQANGFANRFLWLCAKRSKLLPEGGNLTDEALASLAAPLCAAIDFAATVGRMKRDDAAGNLWRELYPALTEGKPGLLGAVTSRAEAQVLRLSMIYALLDLSETIRLEHLRSALAVWGYCEASARYIFGDALGDSIADTILRALRGRAETGLSRTEIRDLFNKHAKEAQIAAALTTLQELGLAYQKQQPTDGRPVERWFAT